MYTHSRWAQKPLVHWLDRYHLHPQPARVLAILSVGQHRVNSGRYLSRRWTSERAPRAWEPIRRIKDEVKRFWNSHFRRPDLMSEKQENQVGRLVGLVGEEHEWKKDKERREESDWGNFKRRSQAAWPVRSTMPVRSTRKCPLSWCRIHWAKTSHYIVWKKKLLENLINHMEIRGPVPVRFFKRSCTNL